MNNSFINGTVHASGTDISTVRTNLYMNDYLGGMMVRWGINRNNYRVNPGLYAVGSPGTDSDVFVTGNYKLTFDSLRKNLAGISGWILVLDTKGVNVWCAAGKGTFGTNELANRINLVSLGKVVNHKRIILPQLGATGVAAHKIKEQTGFNVHYGPVRASDIGGFIGAGYRATKEMRKVTFNFPDRIKLIPNDFMYGKFYLLCAFAVTFLISILGSEVNTVNYSFDKGFRFILNIFLAYSSGIILTPMLLPYIPGRQFSLKGFFTGSVIAAALFLFKKTGNNLFEIISWFMIIPSVSSFMAMNFTGSSTYTSLSGVKKEMKTAVPLQIIFSATGVIILVISRFIK
jgi:hypothetical protein